MSHLNPQGESLLKPATVPIKVAWFGPQGSGKSTSAGLLSLALSKEVYGGAPVYVTDTEPGWQFLRPLFAIEGVELIQKTTPTFKAMIENLKEAEKIGACVWNVDTLTIMWLEIMQTFKKRNNGQIPIHKWGDLREIWNNEYVRLFMNTKMCCQALGRVGNITEDIQDEQNPSETKSVKTGTRFKAGGSEDFGYEPHLVLEVSPERKAKTKAGSKLEGEGRVIHRVDVLKDRTWALNGKVIRWSDKQGYQKGGYRQVWESLKPHYEAMQAMGHVQIATGASSQSLIASDGNSSYYHAQRRRIVALQEIEGTLVTLWPGMDAKSKQLKMTAIETLFHTRAWAAVEDLPLEHLEIAISVLHLFEDAVKIGKTDILTEKDKAHEYLDLLHTRVLESGNEPIEKTVQLEGMGVR